MLTEAPPSPFAASASPALAPDTAPPPASAPTENGKEEDDSRAGSMTLLLPQHQQVLISQPTIPMTLAKTGKQKQTDQHLPMPMPTLQRPRKRLVVKKSASSSSGTTWVLALLAAAAIMAAVAAAAIAMAARAEIFRLRAEVDNVRERLRYHETLLDIQTTLDAGMEPLQLQEDEEDVVWEQQTADTDALSPAYPDLNEFEFAADVKGNSASSRHSNRRRHIPTVSASYESSENGWHSRPGKSEKRLKLYEALASGSLPAEPAPADPTKVSEDAHAHARFAERYHHRSSGGRVVAALTAAAPHHHQQAQPQGAPPAVPPVLTAAPLPAPENLVVARRQDSFDS